MGIMKDLKGKRFGKLVALKRSARIDSRRNYFWLCKCDCGAVREISTVALKRGQKSCGCEKNIKEPKKNEYFTDNNGVVHVKLQNGHEMLCNIQDWENYCHLTWFRDRWGYAIAHENGKNIKFHIAIMGKKDNYVIDHIDQNKLNNKRENLRYLTKSGNAINSKLSSNNTTGVKGITRNRNKKKWIAQIMVNRKHIHLGTFDKLEDAIRAREDAEEKYFKPILEQETK